MEELIEIIRFLYKIQYDKTDWRDEFQEFLNNLTYHKFTGVSEEIRNIIQRYEFHFEFYVKNPEWRDEYHEYYGEEKLREHIDNFFAALKALDVDVDSIVSES